jgi:hypothetical protein
MGETSSEGGRRSGTKPARPYSTAHKAQERRIQARRRTALVNGSMLILIIAAAVLVIRAALPKLAQPNASAPPGMSDNDLRTARITRDLDGGGCAQQAFDNQTGRMTSAPQPCQTTVYDGNGVPVPLGTIHRLDSISKSFPGR